MLPSIKQVALPLIMMCFALGACDYRDTIDTSAAEKSFSSAQPISQKAVDDLKAAVAAKDFGKASAILQKPAAGAKRRCTT